jgi:hypothetical protein
MASVPSVVARNSFEICDESFYLDRRRLTRPPGQHAARKQTRRDGGEAQVQPGIREKHSGGRTIYQTSADQPIQRHPETNRTIADFSRQLGVRCALARLDWS